MERSQKRAEPWGMRRQILFAAVFILLTAGAAAAAPSAWEREWPETDFETHAVPLDEIISGGVPKDAIPSIDDPVFRPAREIEDLGGREPVIRLEVAGEVKAYPLRILTWHEIANDVIGGVPVAVTYCPLCNAAIVFDRRLDGQILEFGTTGKLRKSDLVMYDRQTESWWQQFLGEAIVGELTGSRLEMLASRIVSWEAFLAEHPEAPVLVPNNEGLRDYGRNPYIGYDSSARPFLYKGDLPEGIPAMAYVVAVGEEAWSLELLREKGRIESGEVVLTWQEGAASALDTSSIDKGREIGNVVVQRRKANGEMEDVVYDLTFAFVFHAFRPEGTLHIE